MSGYNIVVNHLKGESNISSDYGSRHPRMCKDATCQICKFVEETQECVVQSLTVSDVMSGSAKMPFLNHSAWQTAQHDCPTLRRTYAHLTQGTHPSKKTKHVKDLRRYLQVATLNERGLLIVVLVVVPCDMLPGLITALHICFQHPTKHQLSSLFQRYFYGLCIDTVISEVTNNRHQCNSLKKLPREVFEQSSSKSPECPGQQFAADVIRRCKQKIFITRDIFSSFSTATLIPDETANTLRDYLIINTAPIRNNNSTICIDNAPGFTALKDDKILQSHGIYLDFSDIKNINKNPQYVSDGTFFVGFIIKYLEKLNAIILIIYSSRPFNVVCEPQVFALRGSD